MTQPQSQHIQQHLHQALSSPLFRNADRQAGFLRYVVERALIAPGATLKEFEIGIAVYNRRDDYDPRTDPIVRVEAARLRARLREYYEITPEAPVRIELPKGGYMPQFVVNQPKATTREFPANGLTLAVTPFRSLGDSTDDVQLCEGLTEELLHRLAEQSGLSVVARDSLKRLGIADAPATHLAEGSVRCAGIRVRVSLHVIELASGSITLSRSYQGDRSDVFALQDAVAQQAAADITQALQVACSQQQWRS